MNWTKEQKDAIYKKDSNILVAAAAGSGKTAVLVERIIQKILKDKIDIDKLLVVTFTNAAASEMRERVLEAIYKKMDEESENENLQKQIILLGKSNICTIHSFCLDVIKNNFFEIDLSPNFRIGQEEEIELLKQEVLEDIFENLYENEDKNFEKLINTYTGYIGDDPLKDIILKIYNFMQSFPFPRKWLSDKIKEFEKNDENKDFAKSVWGNILLKNLKEEIIDSINSLKIIENKLCLYDELEKYKLTIEDDIYILKKFYEKTNDSWDIAYEFAQNMKFKSWPVDRKIELELKDESKRSRDVVKNKIMKLTKDILIYDSKSAYNDIYEMYDILDILKNVIFKFDEEFKIKKHEKNIIDFNDIEHYALEILLDRKQDGSYIPSEVAKRYQEKFEEIAIDEYQDSNQVQELILKSVSRGNNLFMVGDVKQSIYKFRQACPKLFLEKYNDYSLDGNNKGLKIQLFKNFRSKENVLDITNAIFESIMSKELGDIDYNKNEYLNLGADYEKIDNGTQIAELNIINLKEESQDIWKNDNEEDTEVEQERQLEKEEIEAKFVAEKIKNIISSEIFIKDKKEGYRKVRYRDIVILLRSTSKLAPIYEKELIKKNIPVFSDASNEYLDTIEIQTITNLLKILDNPIDDIALVSILRSKIGQFTDNEIAEIRLCKKDTNFYDSLKESKEKLKNPLKNKVINFLNNLDIWRKESEYLDLSELIWKIYVDTGYYSYVGMMQNGTLRQANLKMLFERAKEYEKTSFKGLFNFIRFLEKLKLKNNDMQSAKIIGENEDVVRIMSIHKSKGLEFPIVFLSSTSKRINMQDLNSNILLHEDIGIGPQYINYEKMIEYSTSAKDAIKIVLKEENIAEEMRILYVALTRAKEKLIITGVTNDYDKEIEQKKEILKIYNLKNEKINPIILKKYISYLDWLELVIQTGRLKDLIKVNVYSKTDIAKIEKEEEIKIREFDFNKPIDLEKYEREFNWEYENEFLTKLPVKTTVSKIKELENDILDVERLQNKEIGIAEITPDFMKEEEKISSARKGTLMHLFLQKLDLSKNYKISDLEIELKNLVYKNIINENEAEFINLKQIEYFMNSDLAKKLRKSNKIEKEKPFCTKLKAKEIFSEAKDETILVQGIIDLYAILDNKIILVDYKTDYITDEKIFIKKYSNQLRIYKKALEDALNKEVSEVYIYSLYLNKEILLDK